MLKYACGPMPSELPITALVLPAKVPTVQLHVGANAKPVEGHTNDGIHGVGRDTPPAQKKLAGHDTVALLEQNDPGGTEVEHMLVEGAEDGEAADIADDELVRVCDVVTLAVDE